MRSPPAACRRQSRCRPIFRLSQAVACTRASRPKPPPSVRPAAPVCDTVPVVVTRPNGSDSRSRSPSVAPGSTRAPSCAPDRCARCSSATDRSSGRCRRRIARTRCGRRPAPPPAIRVRRAKFTDSTTSAAPAQRAMSAGRRSKHAVPDFSRVVVADGIGQQQLATEACTEVVDVQARQRDLLAVARDRIDISGNGSRRQRMHG